MDGLDSPEKEGNNRIERPSIYQAERPKRASLRAFYVDRAQNTSFVVSRIHTSADVASKPDGYPLRMDKKTIVLVVTHSIPLADGLNALLSAITQIDEVKIARNFESAIQQIEEGKPQIALIDAIMLGKQPEVFLERLLLRSPETQRVLLVDDVQQGKWMPQYAEAILIKGVAPSAIVAIVTKLLSPEGEEKEPHGSNQ